MDQLKALLAVIAAYLGKRIFGWATAALVTFGVVAPWTEDQIVAFITAAFVAVTDLVVYLWRHRNDTPAES